MVVVVVGTGKDVAGGEVVEVGWSVIVVVGEVGGGVEDSGVVERVISLEHPVRSETHRATMSMTLGSAL